MIAPDEAVTNDQRPLATTTPQEAATANAT
jgi:hypothetical protein